MDGNGARELSRRLEAQEHWRQATAVQTGEQPAADPDGQDLEELGDGIRLYRREAKAGMFNESDSRVGDRLCKRLVDGRWETSIEVDPAP
jgi:hypothetical protein